LSDSRKLLSEFNYDIIIIIFGLKAIE